MSSLNYAAQLVHPSLDCYLDPHDVHGRLKPRLMFYMEHSAAQLELSLDALALYRKAWDESLECHRFLSEVPERKFFSPEVSLITNLFSILYSQAKSS